MTLLRMPAAVLMNTIVRVFLSVVLLTQVCPVYVAQAQSTFQPVHINVLTPLSVSTQPPLLAGIKVDVSNPLVMDFLIDQGDRPVPAQDKEQLYQQFMRYFLAALTTPQEDMWVNLSPYEADRIVSAEFGETSMGHALLAQDYMLKQISASLLHPDNKVGQAFWEKIYQRLYEKHGVTNLPVDTFHKVWIVPGTATVFEHDGLAMITEARMTVMLEQDYVAQQHNRDTVPGTRYLNTSSEDLSSDVMREVIIPVLEQEINEGAHFVPLRQIHHALILAKWYKERLSGSVLGQAYVDQHKNAGVQTDDPAYQDDIYQRYVATVEQGAVNEIREEFDPYTLETLPRHYFSGGWSGDVTLNHQHGKDLAMVVKNDHNFDEARFVLDKSQTKAKIKAKAKASSKFLKKLAWKKIPFLKLAAVIGVVSLILSDNKSNDDSDDRVVEKRVAAEPTIEVVNTNNDAVADNNGEGVSSIERVKEALMAVSDVTDEMPNEETPSNEEQRQAIFQDMESLRIKLEATFGEEYQAVVAERMPIVFNSNYARDIEFALRTEGFYDDKLEGAKERDLEALFEMHLEEMQMRARANEKKRALMTQLDDYPDLKAEVAALKERVDAYLSDRSSIDEGHIFPEYHPDMPINQKITGYYGYGDDAMMRKIQQELSAGEFVTEANLRLLPITQRLAAPVLAYFNVVQSGNPQVAGTYVAHLSEAMAGTGMMQQMGVSVQPEWNVVNHLRLYSQGSVEAATIEPMLRQIIQDQYIQMNQALSGDDQVTSPALRHELGRFIEHYEFTGLVEPGAEGAPSQNTIESSSNVSQDGDQGMVGFSDETRGGIDFDEAMLSIDHTGSPITFEVPPGYEWLLEGDFDGLSPRLIEIIPSHGQFQVLPFFKGLIAQGLLVVDDVHV